MKNLFTTKCPTFLQRKSVLESSKHFLEHTKTPASKQNNMTIIHQEHQNTGKPYIFINDPKFINLFDI